MSQKNNKRFKEPLLGFGPALFWNKVYVGGGVGGGGKLTRKGMFCLSFGSSELGPDSMNRKAPTVLLFEYGFA